MYAYSYTTKNHEPYEHLTKWKINKACVHAKSVGPGMPIEKVNHHRIHIDTKKLDHLLDFINRLNFYQDVSFST